MNSPPLGIETDPLVFDKLLAPIEAALNDRDRDPLSQAAGKLGFRVFVRLLLFRLFAQIRSLRDLTTDLKSSTATRALGFPVVGLSTLHDAFARYPVTWFVTLSMALVQRAALPTIPEVAALGQLWCVDSSFWPVVRSLAWLDRQGLCGVRLHLGLSLNTYSPALFVLSYDTSPTQSERRILLEIAQAGVTYILDRGYVKLGLYLGLIERGAFFVIRQKNNLTVRTLASIEVVSHPALVAVVGLSDEVVRLAYDPRGTVFRLVSFHVGTHQFQVLTNRWDLATWQIVMLYAWRWQVELVFRAWKHTLAGLHLINLSEAGIAMQFHVLLIASILWVAFEHETSAALAASDSHAGEPTPRHKASTPTAILSKVFQVSWRLARSLLRLMHNCLSQSFSFYLGRRVEMRL